MNNLAKAYAEGNRYDEAEKMVLKTIKLAEEADSDFRAVFMANLGTILLEKGKWNTNCAAVPLKTIFDCTFDCTSIHHTFTSLFTVVSHIICTPTKD